jgi:hypothetical protein
MTALRDKLESWHAKNDFNPLAGVSFRNIEPPSNKVSYSSVSRTLTLRHLFPAAHIRVLLIRRRLKISST